jgi:hypothetical protein
MLELVPSEDSTAEVPADAPPADPYGGVALGVECAWPREALAAFQL